MKFANFIFVFVSCFILISCSPRVKQEIDLDKAWAIEEAKVTEATATLVGAFVASELSLNSSQTEKFVKAYLREREAAVKREAELTTASNRRQEAARIYDKNEEGLLVVLTNNLNPEQVKKALNILRPDGRLGGFYGFIDSSVERLVRGKVARNKIEKTLPILAKYHQQFAALSSKSDAEGISREDRLAKVIELRMATAKELAPIIGAEAANFWLDLRTRRRNNL